MQSARPPTIQLRRADSEWDGRMVGWLGNAKPIRPNQCQLPPNLWFLRRFFPLLLSHVTDLFILGSNHRIPRDAHDDHDDGEDGDEFLFSLRVATSIGALAPFLDLRFVGRCG